MRFATWYWNRCLVFIVVVSCIVVFCVLIHMVVIVVFCVFVVVVVVFGFVKQQCWPQHPCRVFWPCSFCLICFSRSHLVYANVFDLIILVVGRGFSWTPCIAVLPFRVKHTQTRISASRVIFVFFVFLLELLSSSTLIIFADFVVPVRIVGVVFSIVHARFRDCDIVAVARLRCLMPRIACRACRRGCRVRMGVRQGRLQKHEPPTEERQRSL